jgi:hypothetical protein
MAVDEKKLNEALDKGALRELPPNVPPGFLGERGLNMSKTDEHKPTLSAGIVQEPSAATRQLTMLLLYLLVVTSPIAVWMLWRDPRRNVWVKMAATLVGLAVYIALWFAYVRQ